MSSKASFQLPPEGLFIPNHEIEDPLRFYYKLHTKYLYRRRIQLGINLLSNEKFKNVLDFGYGSGLLFPSLNMISENLYGIDIASDPAVVKTVLDKIDIKAELKNEDITTANYPSDFFDLIVSFSVFEHISDPDPILKEIYKILKPGGKLLVGMPRVDKGMIGLFRFIGFKDIDQHHVSNHSDFIKSAKVYFNPVKSNSMFTYLPESLGLYFNMLFEKKIEH
jgi:2-polyprenyl-3-methyl-5-hydroxy-6-metoxy-1,4-benzoquinol methylase